MLLHMTAPVIDSKAAHGIFQRREVLHLTAVRRSLQAWCCSGERCPRRDLGEATVSLEEQTG
jgi:hypothetical protein